MKDKKEKKIESKDKSAKNKIKKIFSSPILIIILSIAFSVILSHIETSYAVTNYLYESEDVGYDNTTSGIVATNVQGAVDELYTCATEYSEIRNLIYPVGSIYISVTDSTAAAVQARFGGTWVAFGSGRTLVGYNSSDTDFNTSQKTGGAKTINLAHSHTVNSHSHTMAHTHNMQTDGFFGYNTSGAGFVYCGGGCSVVSPYVTTSTPSTESTGTASPGTDSKLSSAQSILQPYITVYMWKRTA